jgi:hypothetical protein
MVWKVAEHELQIGHDAFTVVHDDEPLLLTARDGDILGYERTRRLYFLQF